MCLAIELEEVANYFIEQVREHDAAVHAFDSFFSYEVEVSLGSLRELKIIPSVAMRWLSRLKEGVDSWRVCLETEFIWWKRCLIERRSIQECR